MCEGHTNFSMRKMLSSYYDNITILTQLIVDMIATAAVLVSSGLL